MTEGTGDPVEHLVPGEAEVPAGTTIASNADLADWLAARMRARQPTALVRFGDSESQLLEAESGKESMDRIIGLLDRETGVRLPEESILALREQVSAAFDQADVLGIRFRGRFADERKKRWLSDLASRYRERVRRGGRPAILARCLFSYSLVDVLPEIVEGGRASVVSCRDLRPVLEDGWGLREVVAHQIPSQWGFRDLDGAYEASMHATPIWPDAIERVTSELKVRERGEVVLVGAGLFGKALCTRVREMGGIAIDMGSALDQLAGKLTRGPERRALELHAAGMPLAAIAAQLESRFDTRVDEGMVAKGLETALATVDGWRDDPLDPAYRTLSLMSLRVEMRGRADRPHCLLAIAEDAGGVRRLLGVWWPDSDASAMRQPAADLKRRGLREVDAIQTSDPRIPGEALREAFPAARLAPMAEPAGICADVQKAVASHGPCGDREAAAKLVAAAFARAEGKRREARRPSTSA